jgi:hypothetical protein
VLILVLEYSVVPYLGGDLHKKYPSRDTVSLNNPMVQATGGGGHPSADPGGGVQRCALPGRGLYKKYPSHDTVPLFN